MNIIGAGVNWHDGYNNNPSLKVQLDAPIPKGEKIYKSYFLDDHGQTLSSEQMAVVGTPVKKSGKEIEILYYQDDFYVRFFKVGGENDYPKGAAGGTYLVEQEDGSIVERKISSGWYISEAVVNNCDDLPEIADVTYLTPEYRNMGLAGNITREKLLEVVEEFLPHVELIPTVRDEHTVRIKERETKKTWLATHEVELRLVKERIAHEKGVDLSTGWMKNWEKITADPRYLEVKNKNYSDYVNQTFIPYKEGYRCSLCGYVEMPTENELKRILMQHTRKDYFLNWCKHYHCCRKR